MTWTTLWGGHDIEDIAPKGVCRLQEKDKTSIRPRSRPDCQAVRTCLQRYKSVNESYHLHLKQVLSCTDSTQSAFKKNSYGQSLPLHQPPLSLLLPSCPFISDIFLPFGVCTRDRSGHRQRLHVFGSVSEREDDQKCVDTHKYVCKTSVTRSRAGVSEDCGCVLKQLVSADRLLTDGYEETVLPRQATDNSRLNKCGCPRSFPNLNHVVIIVTTTTKVP